MADTRPAPLLDTPSLTLGATPAPRPFDWAVRRPVLAALALIGVIVLLALWTAPEWS
ncbi:hypothetical protein ACNI65_05660 [Roseateles sp. So40a]|uniref:hypothetical protein n=1 Tax=Roseateles sp. So40a TaxID=3400226 RepID=UPI003A83F9D2